MDIRLRVAARKSPLFVFIQANLRRRRHVAGAGFRELAAVWHKVNRQRKSHASS